MWLMEELPLRQAVFLDRDGTVVEDVSYCRRPEQLRLLPRVAEAVALLNEAGVLVVVVTNQSGIARGYFDVEALEAIHGTMRRELAKGGARIDALYYCPHHPDEECTCRKPRTGLLLRAAKEMGLDLGHSFMVGDRELDVIAGQSVGCRTVFVETGPVGLPKNGIQPDYRANTLYEAARWIISRRQ